MFITWHYFFIIIIRNQDFSIKDQIFVIRH